MSTGTRSFFGSAKNSLGNRLAGTPSIGWVSVEQPVAAVTNKPAASVFNAAPIALKARLFDFSFVVIPELSSSEGSNCVAKAASRSRRV